MVLAFATLGLLIGNLVGLTAESIVSSLVALLFVCGGGSAIGFLVGLDADRRKAASVAISSLSLACLVGIYTGILVSEYQLLTPPERRAEGAKFSIGESIPLSATNRTLKNVYVRAFLTTEANQIDQLKVTGKMSAEEAYEALYKLISEEEPP